MSRIKDEGHIYAKDSSWKLEWNRHTLTLLEAPIRSPKQRALNPDPERGAKAVQWNWNHWHATPQDRYPVLHNVLPRAGITVNDSAVEVRAKLEIAFLKFISFLRREGAANLWSSRMRDDEMVEIFQKWLSGKDSHYPLEISWYKTFVAPSEFIPKDMKPLKIQGKNFEMTITPNEFGLRKYHGNDPYEPSYSGFTAASPAAARKLYLAVANNPQQFAQMTESEFREWLRERKIPTKSDNSYYR